jgi:hypothetical protein
MASPMIQENSLVIFSDNEVEDADGMNADLTNLSPPNH